MTDHALIPDVHDPPSALQLAGQAANHVPTGLQLVGPAYEDAAVFQAAAAYEAANPLFFKGDCMNKGSTP